MSVLLCASADWAQAFAAVGIAAAVAVGYAAWRFTGGKHEGERR